MFIYLNIFTRIYPNSCLMFVTSILLIYLISKNHTSLNFDPKKREHFKIITQHYQGVHLIQFIFFFFLYFVINWMLPWSQKVAKITTLSTIWSFKILNKKQILTLFDWASFLIGLNKSSLSEPPPLFCWLRSTCPAYNI